MADTYSAPEEIHELLGYCQHMIDLMTHIIRNHQEVFIVTQILTSYNFLNKMSLSRVFTPKISANQIIPAFYLLHAFISCIA